MIINDNINEFRDTYCDGIREIELINDFAISGLYRDRWHMKLLKQDTQQSAWRSLMSE